MNETTEHTECHSRAEPSLSGDTTEPTVLFVSDSHFHLRPGPAETARMDQFLQLLALAHQVDHLVLLGDIFDFWFDYPHFRLKGYEALLYGLDEVRAAGTHLHFVGGNHDIWAADYFHQRYGCTASGTPETIQFGSRRVRLDHGDGLLKFDWAYNSFRAMVRTRPGIVLAKSLHPEILFALSTWLSGKSRSATRDEAAAIEERGRHWLAGQESAPWDLLIMGHVHHGFVHENGGRQLAALAGWFDPLGYGLLRNGRFSLHAFGQEPNPLK